MSSGVYSQGIEFGQEGGTASKGRSGKAANEPLRLSWSLRPRGTLCEARVLPDVETIAADVEVRAIARAAIALPIASLGSLSKELARSVKPMMARAVALTDLARIGQCDIDTHDAFFGIVRCKQFSARVLLASQVSALALLHKDLRASETSLPPERLQLLERGLRLCIALAMEVPMPAQPLPLPQSRAPRTTASSVRRWLRGHHTFAALSQGLVICFAEIAKFHGRGDAAKVKASAEAAAVLLRASAASLEFTGDMPAAHYNDTVRHAMAPPIMPPGFSGLHSSDHRHLVKCMKEAKEALGALKAVHPHVYAQIPAALTEVYDSHKLVCSAFLGNSEKSLLMATEAQASGAEQIENFKRSRLRMIGVASTGACG